MTPALWFHFCGYLLSPNVCDVLTHFLVWCSFIFIFSLVLSFFCSPLLLSLWSLWPWWLSVTQPSLNAVMIRSPTRLHHQVRQTAFIPPKQQIYPLHSLDKLINMVNCKIVRACKLILAFLTSHMACRRYSQRVTGSEKGVRRAVSAICSKFPVSVSWFWFGFQISCRHQCWA